jgi:hypothetical protein
MSEGNDDRGRHTTRRSTRTKPLPNPQFRTAIERLVTDLDTRPNEQRPIPELYTVHQIKRRRLYDIVNVFTAIGCVTRSGPDTLIWNGRHRILPQLLLLKAESGLTDLTKSVTTLFPTDNCVGLCSLTTAFLLLFPALNVTVLDLRNVTAFFARRTPRYKTTLSKMYQIALILASIDVIERKTAVGQVQLREPYTKLVEETDEHPLAITSLLNPTVQREEAIQSRRSEFEREAAAAAPRP